MKNTSPELLIKRRNVTRYFILYTAFFLTLVVFISFILPLIAAFFPSLFSKNFTAVNETKSVEVSRIFSITTYTLKLAAGSTLVALAVGVPAAFFCAKRKFFFKKFLLGLSAVPLCIPILIACLGAVSVFGLSGFVNSFFVKLGFEKSRALYSQGGIMIAQGFYNFPLIMSITSRFWAGLPCESENAARLLGANERRVFFKITLPALLPCIAAAVIPVFLFCYFSFMMVLLFSVPGTSTLEVEIYQAVKTSLDFNLASRLAVTETFTAVLFVSLYSIFAGKEKVKGEVFQYKELPFISSGDYEPLYIKILEALFFIILFSLIILFFILPLGGIIASGFTSRVSGKDVFSFNQYKNLFRSKVFWESLVTTLKISFCTAIVCTCVGLVYALSLQKLDFKYKKILSVIALLPMAVSSIVLGFGITLLFKKGNSVSLVLVQSALFWPLAFRQIQSALNKIPDDVQNSAVLLSDNYTESVFRVIIPWIRKTLFASFGFCFAFSAGDTTLPLILSVPKFTTLSLYTYRLSGSYRFNTACASGTILALVCFIVFILSEKIGGGKE